MPESRPSSFLRTKPALVALALFFGLLLSDVEVLRDLRAFVKTSVRAMRAEAEARETYARAAEERAKFQESLNRTMNDIAATASR